ncbi:MAG: prephenate dehydrogenase/arogenate dehydrogenase family protein [Thermoguttaceae bacterium]
MKQWDTVAIVGVGLIGGSIGLALRQRNLAKSVVGIGRGQPSLRIARRVGAVTHTTIDLNKGVADAELVIVCTPVGHVVEQVKQAAQHCLEQTLITDTGSAKQQLVETLDGGLAHGCRFLGSHPLAGSEKTGAQNASADLFDGRVAIITPTINTRAEDFDLLAEFWQSLGSVVVRMSPEEHDEALAMTSHLPHVAAAVLALTMPEKYFRLAGRGVLDTTRVAASDPQLWCQVLKQNRENILTALEEYGGKLSAMHAAIRDNDQETIARFLTQARKNRNALGS